MSSLRKNSNSRNDQKIERNEQDGEVYMEQPPSFIAQGKSDLVCKLFHSLYGMKQSP